MSDYLQFQNVVFSQLSSGQLDQANATLKAGSGTVDALDQAIEGMHQNALKIAKEQSDKNTNLANTTKKIMLILAAVGILVNETELLTAAFGKGQTSTRYQAERLSGSFKEIVEEINNALDKLNKPWRATVSCLKKMGMGKGNFDLRFEGSFEGDYAILQNEMNTTLESINEILLQFSAAVDQVASGSQQISESSQALSQGAAESASAVEQTSASMHEMASQTNLNASNAMQANQLAVHARDLAEKGNSMMTQMVGAMDEINGSANNISKNHQGN